MALEGGFGGGIPRAPVGGREPQGGAWCRFCVREKTIIESATKVAYNGSPGAVTVWREEAHIPLSWTGKRRTAVYHPR